MKILNPIKYREIFTVWDDDDDGKTESGEKKRVIYII